MIERPNGRIRMGYGGTDWVVSWEVPAEDGELGDHDPQALSPWERAIELILSQGAGRRHDG